MSKRIAAVNADPRKNGRDSFPELTNCPCAHKMKMRGLILKTVHLERAYEFGKSLYT